LKEHLPGTFYSSTLTEVLVEDNQVALPSMQANINYANSLLY